MGWADDRGFERWRSDAIRLSNRLEARVPERGGGGGRGSTMQPGRDLGRGGKGYVCGMVCVNRLMEG